MQNSYENCSQILLRLWNNKVLDFWQKDLTLLMLLTVHANTDMQ